MRTLWNKFILALKALVFKEPALVAKVVTWAVTLGVAYVSDQWFDWADTKEATIAGLVVAYILGMIADWVATRQMVYAPRSVAVVADDSPYGGSTLSAGPASILSEGTPVEVGPVTYGGKHQATYGG